MTYGLKVTGEDANGTYVVSDTDQSFVPMVVANVGQGTNVEVPSSGRYLLYVNQEGLYGTISGGGGKTATRVTIDTTTNIAYFWYASNYSITVNAMGTTFINATWSNASTCRYIVLAEASALTAPAGESYGIKIDDASGNEVFDSRKFTINDSFRLLGQYEYADSYSATVISLQQTIVTDGDMFVEMAPYTEFTTSSTTAPDNGGMVGIFFRSTGPAYSFEVGSLQRGKYYGGVTFGKLLYNPTNITAGKPGGWTQPY